MNFVDIILPISAWTYGTSKLVCKCKLLDRNVKQISHERKKLRVNYALKISLPMDIKWNWKLSDNVLGDN